VHESIDQLESWNVHRSRIAPSIVIAPDSSTLSIALNQLLQLAADLLGRALELQTLIKLLDHLFGCVVID
jgi:hypothetical protein